MKIENLVTKRGAIARYHKWNDRKDLSKEIAILDLEDTVINDTTGAPVAVEGLEAFITKIAPLDIPVFVKNLTVKKVTTVEQEEVETLYHFPGAFAYYVDHTEEAGIHGFLFNVNDIYTGTTTGYLAIDTDFKLQFVGE